MNPPDALTPKGAVEAKLVLRSRRRRVVAQDAPDVPVLGDGRACPDRELGPLLSRLAEAGFDNPIIDHVGAEPAPDRTATPARVGAADLPGDWRPVREREGESYRWPDGRDRYKPNRVFLGPTRAEGAVQIGLGETIRKNRWGATESTYADRFRTQLYNERVVHPGAWSKIVVVAREDDDEVILNHALLQSRRRHRT